MRVANRFPVAVGAALLAISLAACSSSDEDAKAKEEASREEAPPVEEQEVSEEAEPQQKEETTATATGPGRGDLIEDAAVTGTPKFTEEWVHVGETGADACNLSDGQITCYFEIDEESCSGQDAMMMMASFAGGKVTSSCTGAGDAGYVPYANVGDIIADPTGTLKCEVVESPNLGVRCTDANGVTALLSALDSRTL